jgi:fructose-1-phosphate kinase PfkB-like protein
VEASALIKKPIQTIKEAIEALSVIHSLGVQQVVISLGKSGAVYFNGSRVWHAMPPRIQVRNPIGAGDAMLAGMLWAFYHDLDDDEVLRWGVACGSASASLDGTAVGSLQMVKSLVSEVRVYEMETP